MSVPSFTFTLHLFFSIVQHLSWKCYILTVPIIFTLLIFSPHYLSPKGSRCVKLIFKNCEKLIFSCFSKVHFDFYISLLWHTNRKKVTKLQDEKLHEIWTMKKVMKFVGWVTITSERFLCHNDEYVLVET